MWLLIRNKLKLMKIGFFVFAFPSKTVQEISNNTVNRMMIHTS